MTSLTVKDDRVLPFTRVLAVTIVPFLLVAVAVLYPWPKDTGRLFAWQIKPTMTAMVLGSAYLGGAYFFFRVAIAKTWHSVKGGFISVAVFASLMGVATIIHWDRFRHGHVAFSLWAFLYFTTPFLVFYVYFANRRNDSHAVSDDLLLSRTAAQAIALTGVLALGVGAFLFLFPERAAKIWPWSLTVLTARVMGAVFCLGLAGIGALVDRRWSSARIPFQVAATMLALIVVAGLRARSEFCTHNVLTWLFALGFVGVLTGIVIVYVRMEGQARSGNGHGIQR
jgi:hypothetical protein